MERTRDSIAGSLYGLLVGDALGCPVEGWSPGEIAVRYGRLTEMVEPRSKRWRPRGLHSDDGQQALALCDAILESPAEPEAAFARILVRMQQTLPRPSARFGVHRGTGQNFRETVLALAAGAGPHGGAQPSSGNGTAMMIAPVAWRWFDDEAELLARSVAVARVKQCDERGIGAASAVAWLVAQGVGGRSRPEVDTGGFVDFTRSVEEEACRQLGIEPRHVFSDALGRMLAARRESTDDVLALISEEANRTASRPVLPGSGYAPASVVTAIWIALTRSSFEEAVVDVLNVGGDTDTTGAMVGAIAGAFDGHHAIPSRWERELLARGVFDDRVDAMVERRIGWMPEQCLVEIEAPWTALRRGGGRS